MRSSTRLALASRTTSTLHDPSSSPDAIGEREARRRAVAASGTAVSGEVIGQIVAGPIERAALSSSSTRSAGTA